MASCHTINSPSDDRTVTGSAASDYTTVKNSKFSRRVKNKWTMIDTYNIFDEFNKAEFQVQETTDQVSEMECNKVSKLVKISRQ